MKRVLNVLAVALHVCALSAATSCPTPRDLQPGAKLDDLAIQYFGSSRYAISIALATNARTGQGFPYISNPDDLTGIARVCIPAKPEARELERRWTAYDKAVAEARLPRTADLSRSLLTIPPDQPVNVVTWVRSDQADRMKTAGGDWITTASADTWVSLEPHLQTFCRQFNSEHKQNEGALERRLEQRLGLAPASSKTTFVRIQLDHPDSTVIFRPCVDPSVDKANCALGPPSKASATYQQWFLQQYYSSYGQSLIGEFPWTSLGYTFDWAPAKGASYQRTGDSEFVISKGAPIKILAAVPTAQYCAASSN